MAKGGSSKLDQLRALRERGVSGDETISITVPPLTVTAPLAKPALPSDALSEEVPLLAPIGVCASCDRRRAAQYDRLRAYRLRKVAKDE